jgi:segregation and condensation protein B
MSLRAKIEAVVYAAEEPVTLTQLAAVFAPEVREIWEAERKEAEAPAVSANGDEAAEHASSEAASDEPAQTGSNPAESDAAGEQASEPVTDGNNDEAAAKRAARNEERAIREYLRKLLDELTEELANGDRGVEIREVAGGYRMATKPEYHDAIRSFVKRLKPPMKLSMQALETLAVVAYKQPVTGPEISEIRGVESGGVLGSLLSRKLITTAGRKQVIGRPILYKTTKEFLLRFGLKDLNELPSIEEFEKMAGELVEADLEPTTEGGLTISQTESSLNDEEDEAADGEAVDPVIDETPANAMNVNESATPEPAMEEQKAGEA